MVRVSWGKAAGMAVCGGLLVIGVWVLIPDLAITQSSPAIRLLWDGIAMYRAEHGRFADSLSEVEAFLEMGTKTDCQIIRKDADRYLVVMPLEGKRVYHLDVSYAVDVDGELEKYDAWIIERTRIR